MPVYSVFGDFESDGVLVRGMGGAGFPARVRPFRWSIIYRPAGGRGSIQGAASPGLVDYNARPALPRPSACDLVLTAA